jgi:L-alanine-DL-glutamate epimerase-like enolase superfamily enzyme
MASTIQNIHLTPLIQLLPPTLRNAARRPLKKEMLIVFAELSSGLSSGHFGIGECWTAGIGLGALTEALNTRLIPLIKDTSPTESKALLQGVLTEAIAKDDTALAAAISGLDCALWDGEAKALGVPLYELLGGKKRDIYTYASGGLYDDNKGLPELADDMRRYVSLGFDAVKIKVAGVPIDEDVTRVKIARETLGPDIRLMIDANAAYSSEEALEISERLLDLNIFWFEEPCEEGLSQLRPKCPMPICGYEREVGRQKFADLVDPDLVDFVQFDLSMCGGITEAIEIMKAAQDRPVSLHGSSSVGLFHTNLQFASAFPQIESVEFHMVHQWSLANIDGHGFAINQGLIQIPDGPGNALNLIPADLRES